MAKQSVGYLGGFQGTLGPAIGYMWNGKWCVRAKPGVVHNPRTPEQVAQREMFKREVQMAADLGSSIKMSLRDMAREAGMTSYNLFVSVNQPAFNLVDGVFTVDYEHLRLSMGDVAPVEAPRMTLTEDNVLEVNYAKGHGNSQDLVYMVVYAPGLKRSLRAAPTFRKSRKMSLLLPDSFAGEEMQVYLMVQSSDGRWSDSQWVDNKEHNMAADTLSDDDSAEHGWATETGNDDVETHSGGNNEGAGGNDAVP